MAITTQQIDAIPTIQAFLENQATTNYRPMRAIVGSETPTSLAQLENLTDYNSNRVSVCALSTSDDKIPAVGLTLGLLSRLPVQRNIGRVKNGALPVENAYLTNGTSVESNKPHFDSLHQNGFLFGRTYEGKAGYYYADDPTCTANSDDYSSLARGRVIDKAFRIAYATFVEEILDEVEVSAEGTLDPSQAKYYQSIIQRAIESNMSANDEISAVSVFVDQNQNVLSTDMIKIELRIQPKGYAKYIKVSLGYSLSASGNSEESAPVSEEA